MKSKYMISILVATLLVGCSSSGTNDETLVEQEIVDANGTDDSEITDTTPKDITDIILTNKSANCKEYVESYYSSVTDIQKDTSFTGTLEIELDDEKCRFTSNSIPNHDFNDTSAHFASTVKEVSLDYSITSNPSFASEVTELALGANAIMLNGVKLDIIAAGCYGVGYGNIGCDDMDTPFRYDPMSSLVSFGTDSHNAHTQSTGQYHYHGDPVALYTNEESSPIESPVIGFAKDGFPIFGMYYKDSNDVIQKTTSSYQLKTGARQTVDGTNPPANDDGTFADYDGQFRDDYEYIEGLGVLDECNGMTLNGVYGYYVTDSFPWVLSCYKGTTDSSFELH